MMKNKFMAGAIIAALLVPAAVQAQAQPHPNMRDRDRGAVIHKGDDRNYRAPERNIRDQRNDRHVQQRNDWRQDQRYRSFRAPFSYQRFSAGSKLRPQYYGHNYRQNWDSRWGLPRAGKNQSYVRHYDDLLLVNDRNGKVVRVYRDLFRYR